MKQLNQLLASTKGRFFSIETKDGTSYNAHSVRVTDSYVTFWDRNADQTVKKAKTSVAKVRVNGNVYKIA